MTPYERLKSLDNAAQYLKEDIAFEDLNKIAYKESDNDFGKRMIEAREELFTKISKNLTK